MGGDLSSLHGLLTAHFSDIFLGGVHILPPYPSTGDRGFAPTTYLEIDPQFGSWEDIEAIGQDFDVMLDFMVNHISAKSDFFQDFVQHGRNSPYADMFITLDKIWPDGNPPPEDIEKIFLRKPEHPFLTIPIKSDGGVEKVWATFGPKVDQSEQIDLDINSGLTQNFYREVLSNFERRQVKAVRIDAVAYVVKKAGTSCFMVEPEIYGFINWLDKEMTDQKLAFLPEIHIDHKTQHSLAAKGYWVYNFVIPMLVLHTLFNKDSRKLLAYLKQCPSNQITMLDCHDGIPVQPDVDDILSQAESQSVIDVCLKRGANLNRLLTKNKIEFDAHQINITYFSALGEDEDAYLAARAIQVFSPGIPQVYYVGLLAGKNDLKGLEKTGEGRAINRNNFSKAEVEQALDQEVVQRLIKLLRFRNEHPAFNGELQFPESAADEIVLAWKRGEDYCRLSIDLATYQSIIEFSGPGGESNQFTV